MDYFKYLLIKEKNMQLTYIWEKNSKILYWNVFIRFFLNKDPNNTLIN